MSTSRRRRRRNSLLDQRAFAAVRFDLYQHLAGQIGNGRALLPSVEDFLGRLERRGKKRAANVLRDIVRRIMDGQSLSQSLASWSAAEELLIIASGDQSGDLPKALTLAVDANERTARIRRMIVGELTAPAVYVISLWAMLYVVGAHVVPQLAVLLPPDKWSGTAYLLYLMGVMSTGWQAVLTPVAAIALVGAAFWSLPRWTGKGRIAAEHVAPWSVYRDLQGYTWLLSFTALLRAGMDNVSVLKRQRQHASPWLAQRLDAARRHMENGWNLGEALAGRRIRKETAASAAPSGARHPATGGFGFPNPDMIDDIAAFVDYPDFPEKITVVAAAWADRLERRVAGLGKILNLGATMGMAFVFIIVQVGANEISSQLSSSLGGMVH